jgi:hypothetical protein
MKASRFTDAQKAFNIRQGDDGTPVAEICRKAGISHPLLFCPPLGHGVRYVLVRRDWPGIRSALGVGRATSVHESINLAG